MVNLVARIPIFFLCLPEIRFSRTIHLGFQILRELPQFFFSYF